MPPRSFARASTLEVLSDDVRGIAIHATARLMGLAAPSEVLTSGVARVLADTADLDFDDRDQHALKGLPRPLDVLSVRYLAPA